MTIVNGKNSDEVILSEGREANEPEDLRLFFGTSQLPGKGLPIRAPLAAGVGNHGLIKLLFLACSLIGFSSIAAQQPQPTAHNIAQRVDRRYNQLHSLRAEFTESYEGLGRARSESGTLLLLKPGRMRWDYSNPAGKVFLLDGKYAWFYSKGDPQVQRIGAKELDDLRSPLRFLLGHTQLEKEIDHLAVTPAVNGSFILAGVPHGQEKRVQRLALTVTADGVITAIEIQETDGAETRFIFTGEQPNVPIAPATFHFTPPPGVPVVDALPPV
ncbi:MAG: outer membrane lipoprotein chaperone LolA [Terracidiphilus sp.]